MRRVIALVTALLILSLTSSIAAAAGKTTQRPLSDWLSANQAFDPTVAIELQTLGWSDTSTNQLYWADLDGRIAAWINANGGSVPTPTYTGRVTERELRDGRAEVKVQLWADSVITYVWQDEADFTLFPDGPMLFGYRASEIVAGATPAYGSFKMQYRFIQPAPGLPLPDVLQIIFDPLPGQEDVTHSFKGAAFGPLRAASGWAEGTPGKATVQQIGLFHTGGGGATADGFPVEKIRLSATNQR